MDSHRSNIKSAFNPHSQVNPRSSPILSSVEKIDVEELIKDFKIVNINNFSAYLKELWEVRHEILKIFIFNYNL
jgi:hypothetical protein